MQDESGNVSLVLIKYWKIIIKYSLSSDSTQNEVYIEELLLLKVMLI